MARRETRMTGRRTFLRRVGAALLPLGLVLMGRPQLLAALEGCPQGEEPCISANCCCGDCSRCNQEGGWDCDCCKVCCDACPSICVPEGTCCDDL
jgi:hypothetical protein